MVDDAENPITRPDGEPQERVQIDDHGQRRDSDELPIVEQEGSRYDKVLQKIVDQNREVTKWDPEFQGDWIQYYSKHINPKEARVFNALYSIEAFNELVGQMRNDIMKRFTYTEQELSNDKTKKEKVDIELSRTIERKIVMSIGKLYMRIDEVASNKTFEEIENTNFMASIKLSYDTIQGKANLLRKELKEEKNLPENLKKLTFYKKYSEEKVIEKDVKQESGKDKKDFQTRPVPTPKSIPTSVEEFLRYTSAQTMHFVELRRYLHDITVLFKQGPGDKGFWKQVAGFAKQITNSDLDSMMLLPDSELFMAAHNLYIKHLTALMARNSWVHQPGMFSADFFEINSDVEKDVLDDLIKLFPDIDDEESERFQRAVKMGVGIARGVTLSEVEIAASADPPHIINSDGKREVSYESLYISDAAPLAAFRPTYNTERFLPPDLTRGPLLYAPVSNFERKPFWNHNELWERMSEYEKSYVNGRDAINIKEGTELLIDAAENFGKVGAIEARSGWRIPGGYETWTRTILDSDGINRGNLDYLETWKQLENIGFVVLNNFIKTKLNHLEDGSNFLLDKRPGRKGERDEFFNYLYEKYINLDPSTGQPYTINTLNQEVNRIKDEIRTKHKTEKKPINEEDIEKDAYKLLLNRALFGLLRQRTPSMFIKLDRDRMAKDGEDAYKKILGITGWDHKDLDKALRNLGDVEMKLRLKTSEEMNKYLSNHANDLADPSIKYLLTEHFIEDSLNGILKNEVNKIEQIENVKILYKTIHKHFLTNESEFAKNTINKLHKGKFKFTIGVEELDRSFLAYRAAGESVLYRSINDTGLIEHEVSERFVEHIKLLRLIAKNPSHDISKLIENLSHIRENISILHGQTYAWQQTSKLVGATIDYFRKDFAGRILWGLGGIGRMNSLAAEHAGTFRGIWEWGNEDIDGFIVECEREGILPKDARELAKSPKIEEKNFLGFKYKKVTHVTDESILTGNKARELFGATKGDLFRGAFLKLGPLILGLVLFNAIKKALEGEKKR